MKAKINHPCFSGVKADSIEKPISKYDLNSRVTIGYHNRYFYKEFRLQNKELDVENIRYFYDLARFFYKGYCCVVKKEDFVKL